jgi:hypothetical protein
MSTSTAPASSGLDVRILNEGYGPGAWHGADMKAALADVSPALAFWRPGPGRHNIAEIALHHAYYAHSVRGGLSAGPIEPFVREGEDWFALDDESTTAWPEILATVEKEQRQLAGIVEDIARGAAASPKTDAERLDLVLGITCHAVYHAGQIQLIKVLHSGAD